MKSSQSPAEGRKQAPQVEVAVHGIDLVAAPSAFFESPTLDCRIPHPVPMS